MLLKKKASFLVVAAICGATFMNSTLADAGDWLIRGRIINVNPDASSGGLTGAPTVGVTADDDSTIELDFTYMVTNNLGLELILATTEHDITATGALAGASVGSVKALPPTLTLQYHFTPKASVRPYAGIGLNYTVFYGSKVSSTLAGAPYNVTKISYDNSFGLAGQVGVDIDINKKWFVNLDAKYIQMDTTATTTGGTLGSVKVDLNPWVLGVGIGTRF